jgi:hypothetical protein
MHNNISGPACSRPQRRGRLATRIAGQGNARNRRTGSAILMKSRTKPFPLAGSKGMKCQLDSFHGDPAAAGIDSAGSEGTARPRRSSMASRAISETWLMVTSVASVPSRKAR